LAEGKISPGVFIEHCFNNEKISVLALVISNEKMKTSILAQKKLIGRSLKN